MDKTNTPCDGGCWLSSKLLLPLFHWQQVVAGPTVQPESHVSDSLPPREASRDGAALGGCGAWGVTLYLGVCCLPFTSWNFHTPTTQLPSHSQVHTPEQRGGNILCQGVNSKYFQLCGQSLPRVVKAPKDDT